MMNCWKAIIVLFNRIYHYLKNPMNELLKLKFDELLLSLFSNKKHQDLTDYFISLCQNQEYHMSRVMEENFAYNLKLENYAQLCHMSLSTFKKSFRQYYHTTPAVWLKQKKLDLALHRIITSDLNINQISFECGFEDTSHFIRVFKQKYHLTPLQYRQKIFENLLITKFKLFSRFIRLFSLRQRFLMQLFLPHIYKLKINKQ